ncbi:MAG: ABC transporter permease [Spirochaetales bacterium]|nr:ABC transporter permease [Spirochaetales bacterium]
MRSDSISGSFNRRFSLIKNARLFSQGAYLSYIALFHWLQPAPYLASKIVMPLAQMFFFVFLGTFGSETLPASFFVIGNAMQMAAVSGIYGVTMAIGGDRWEGTLVYLFGTPAPRMSIFLGRASAHILDGILGIIIGFFWGWLLLGLDLGSTNFALLALAVVVTVFSTSGLGLVMGCVGLITRNVMFVNNTIYFLLLLLSGANVPLDRLPGWLRGVSRSLPLSRGIEAARLIISGGETGRALTLLAGEAAVGAAYLVVGYLLFSGFEKAAKRRGSLEVA